MRDVKVSACKISPRNLLSIPQRKICEATDIVKNNNVCFIFILLASPKKKQTNRKKECWQGHCNSCGQLQRAQILIKEIKTRNIKKRSDTRKSTAMYNKLLDETKDEHYYILNG